MNQTRLSSLIEAVMNVAIGFVVSVILTAVVLPAYGHAVTFSQNLQITAIFTVASIARSYCIRRWFNARIKRAALRLAQETRPCPTTSAGPTTGPRTSSPTHPCTAMWATTAAPACGATATQARQTLHPAHRAPAAKTPSACPAESETGCTGRAGASPTSTAHPSDPFHNHQEHPMNLASLPPLGQPLDGGIFAGLTTRKDGTHCAVALLPGRKEDITWQDAKAWAAEQGGELPTRPVAALLFANVKDQLQPDWHWTADEEGAASAWYCYFDYGYQHNAHESYEGSVVAVRLIPLTA